MVRMEKSQRGNRKEKKLIISSISDIITNSSSEVFLIDMNDDYKDFMKELGFMRNESADVIKEHMHEFHKLSDVKEYLDNGGTFNDLSLFEKSYDDYCFYDNMVWDYMFDHDSTPPDDIEKKKIWNKCKKSYDEMLGKAMIIIDDIDDAEIQNKELRDTVFNKIYKSNLKYKLGFCG